MKTKNVFITSPAGGYAQIFNGWRDPASVIGTEVGLLYTNNAYIVCMQLARVPSLPGGRQIQSN